MVIRRGEIWWAELQDPVGSGPGYRRPVVVIQSDYFNVSLIYTVIAVAVISNLKLADAPGNVLLPKKQTRLPKDSVANVSQVITLDKSLLAQKAGNVPPRLLRRIEEGLRLAMSL